MIDINRLEPLYVPSRVASSVDGKIIQRQLSFWLIHF